MSNVFANSRCNEILDSAFAQAGGKAAVRDSGNLPLEARIIVVLTLKMQIITMLNPALTTQQTAEAFSLLHRGFSALVPELDTKEGAALYDKLTEVFTRDMKDLKNGRL